MPAGIPVATVAIDGARNAALLAAAILALSDPELERRLGALRAASPQGGGRRRGAVREQVGTVSREIELAAAALARGEVVCLPTETSYGLADRSATAGVARMTRAEGRAAGPLAVPAHRRRRGDGARPGPGLAGRPPSDWPRALAGASDPGPTGAPDGLPPEVIGPDGGVGVRVSSHPLAAALASRRRRADHRDQRQSIRAASGHHPRPRRALRSATRWRSIWTGACAPARRPPWSRSTRPGSGSSAPEPSRSTAESSPAV